MNYDEVKYLVFDVESVPDARLISRVKYPGENLDEIAVVKRFQDEIMESTDGKSEFIPVTFQYPVAIAVAKVREDYSLMDVVSLDDPHFRTPDMVRLFWLGIEDLYKHCNLVTFNGRGFDLPLLELMLYRYGFSAPRHFKDRFSGRNRFGTKHIDLQDWMSNYGSIRMTGGLNLLAKVIGKPGKMGTVGDQVYGMFLEGKIREINDYCIHDVLDTYFVFLRTRVIEGSITLKREQDIVRNTKKFLEENSSRISAFRMYLDNWGDWEPWPSNIS